MKTYISAHDTSHPFETTPEIPQSECGLQNTHVQLRTQQDNLALNLQYIIKSHMSSCTKACGALLH